MAKSEEKGKKGLLERAVDALSSRDEREQLEEIQKKLEEKERELLAAKQQAQVAQAKAAAAATAEQKAKEAAAEAQAKLEQMQRQKQVDELRERFARMQEERARRAEEAAQAQAEAEKPRTYVVKSGDSLSKIAKELLGDAKRWPEIFEANRDKIKDPNLIYPGQELLIPKK